MVELGLSSYVVADFGMLFVVGDVHSCVVVVVGGVVGDILVDFDTDVVVGWGTKRCASVVGIVVAILEFGYSSRM